MKRLIKLVLVLMVAFTLALPTTAHADGVSVTVGVSPEGTGTVSGAGPYQAGDSVTVSASANAGYEFSHWEGDPGTSASASYTFTVPEGVSSVSVTAYFVEHGHTWDGGVVTTEPTTALPGVRTYTCTTCGATYTEEIPRLVASYTISASASPSEGGSVSGGGTYTEGAEFTLSASASSGYAFVHWEDSSGAYVSGSPSFSQGAVRSESYVAVFSKKHTHTLRKVDEVKATCTKDGCGAYYVCTGCGSLFLDEGGANEIPSKPVIKALGHKWDSGRVTRKATATKEGRVVYTCQHDRTHTKTATVPALGAKGNPVVQPSKLHSRSLNADGKEVQTLAEAAEGYEAGQGSSGTMRPVSDGEGGTATFLKNLRPLLLGTLLGTPTILGVVWFLAGVASTDRPTQRGRRPFGEYVPNDLKVIEGPIAAAATAPEAADTGTAVRVDRRAGWGTPQAGRRARRRPTPRLDTRKAGARARSAGHDRCGTPRGARTRRPCARRRRQGGSP